MNWKAIANTIGGNVGLPAKTNGLPDWGTVAKRVRDAAPAVGSALAGPAGALMGMVVAGRLGVNPTPEAVMSAIDLDPDYMTRIAEIEKDKAIATLADVQQARVAHNGHWMPPVLTVLLTLMFCGAGYALFSTAIPAENRDMVNIVFGALLGAFSTAIQFWLGSSNGSSQKQNTIDRLMQ